MVLFELSVEVFFYGLFALVNNVDFTLDFVVLVTKHLLLFVFSAKVLFVFEVNVMFFCFLCDLYLMLLQLSNFILEVLQFVISVLLILLVLFQFFLEVLRFVAQKLDLVVEGLQFLVTQRLVDQLFLLALARETNFSLHLRLRPPGLVLDRL